MKSKEGVQPECGDILRHTAFHMDVAYGFDGDVLIRVAAGQGGPKWKKENDKEILDEAASCDILTRVRGASSYDPKKLQGWINIDVYYSTTPQTAPVPAWLVGWWKVTWAQRVFYYFFDDTHRTVTWAEGDKSHPVQDTGKFAVGGPKGPSAVTILWGATGSVEKYDPPTGDNNTMAGLLNGKDQLRAEKN